MQSDAGGGDMRDSQIPSWQRKSMAAYYSMLRKNIDDMKNRGIERSRDRVCLNKLSKHHLNV